jgi:CheY-like chemotaxis protein/DNA-directed RNA polymerase specialized sigma24 family protein
MSSMASALAPHIPHLRRFSRALTGSQESGDAYVVATLEALVADPGCFPNEMPHRVGLFHAFVKVWNSIAANNKSEPVASDLAAEAADRKLERIQPLPRQAFLLTALEDFSNADTARILSKTVVEVNALIEEASREIAEQVATNVLIIEDEPLIAMDLEELVTSLGHSVTEIARTRSEAVQAAKLRKPGLILADINLADGSSGLDAVNDLLEDLNVPVIFITAYPERLLTGKRPEPTFLITKPFQPSMIKAIISQALFFEQNAGQRAAG